MNDEPEKWQAITRLARLARLEPETEHERAIEDALDRLVGLSRARYPGHDTTWYVGKAQALDEQIAATLDELRKLLTESAPND